MLARTSWRWLVVSIFLLQAMVGLVECTLPLNESSGFEELPLPFGELLPRQAKIQLRIMPLGASITAGVGSSPADGYRKALRTLLRYSGFPVNMVGSQPAPGGSMRNSANEGYPGLRISEVRDRLTSNGYLNRKPNIVLLHVGSNNCLQSLDFETAGKQLEDFANYIFSQVAGVAIVMSTLGPLTKDSSANYKCLNLVNPQIRDAFTRLSDQGKNVELVDFGATSGYYQKRDIGSDGIHPSNSGYSKMAEMWNDAIQHLYRRGRINVPAQTQWPDVGEGSGSNTCEKVAGQAYGPIDTQVQSLNVGSNDGLYKHSSRPWGYLKAANGADLSLIGTTNYDMSINIFFGQLVNPSGTKNRNHIQDELIVYGGVDDDISVGAGRTTPFARVYVNNGNGVFANPVDFDVKDGKGCRARGTWWGDVNNDGLDDYICIGLEGHMYVSLNRGGNPPRFEYLGLYKDAVSGFPQANVRLADIDGDGRLDYCVTAGNGDISCWRNGGTFEDRPTFWQDIGIIFEGKGMGDIRGTRFLDINGDHRDDWVWVYDDTGKTRIFSNERGRFEGMKPFWQEAASAHAGVGGNQAWLRLKFAKLFFKDAGTRSDYIRVEVSESTGAFKYREYKLNVWENLGSGGTQLRGDGNRYCDMTGSGRDDLLWVSDEGVVSFWKNINTRGHLTDPWEWNNPVSIININADGAWRDRRGIVFADWDGDGKCDALYFDRLTGTADWWRNTGTNGGVSFGARARLNALCNPGIGVGLRDNGLRFADINGDKRADWLCMQGDGTTTGYLNLASGLRDMGQIKKPEGHERANLIFADVNGDGRADLLFADNLNGDTQVWTNEGEDASKPSGSSFRWTPKGKQYDGQTRGQNQYYPDFDGDGRDDLHIVQPETNTAVTWFNICRDQGSGIDDPDATNPNEPPLPTCPSTCDLGYCGPDGSENQKRRTRRKGGAVIEKRGASRTYQVPDIVTVIIILSRSYPSLRDWLRATPAGRAHTLYFTRGQDCEDAEMQTSSADDSNGNLQNPLPREWENNVDLDHPWDLQTMSFFLSFIITGDRPNGRGRTTLPLIPEARVAADWRNANIIPTGPNQPLGEMNAYIMEGYGSNTLIGNFIPVRNDINRMKGNAFGALVPQELDQWESRVKSAHNGNVNEFNRMLATLHELLAVFEYASVQDNLDRLTATLAEIRRRWLFVEANVPGWTGVSNLWQQFTDDQLHAIVQAGYDWIIDAMGIMWRYYDGENTLEARTVLRAISRIYVELVRIRIGNNIKPNRDRG